MSMELCRKPLDERQEQVLRLHEEAGLSYREIGAQLGVSHHRVRQIYATGKTRRDDFARNGEDALCLLPLQVRKVVEILGITSRAKTRAAIKSGKLWWNEPWGRAMWEQKRVYHAGWQSWVVLNEWAGLPRPKSKRVFKCPHCGKSIDR